MMIPDKPPPLTVLFLVAFVYLGLILLVTIPFGPGLSTDSVNYISTADSLAAGEGFINHNNSVYQLWPPLYPIMLAIPKALFGIKPIYSGWVINGIAAVATILLGGILFRNYIESKHTIWLVVGLFVTFFSPSIFNISINIVSDLFFLCLVLLFLGLLRYYIQKQDRKSLIAITVIVGLAVLQRYIGVVLIATGVISILYRYRQNLNKSLSEITIFSLSALPLSIWMIRNYIVTKTFFGSNRSSSWNNWLINISDTGKKLAHWFLPYSILNEIWLVIIICILIASFFFLFRHRLPSLYKHLTKPTNLPLLIFLIIYFVMINYAIQPNEHKQIYDDRLILPLYIPLWILIALIIDFLVLSNSNEKKTKLVSFLILSLLLIWAISPINTMRKWVQLTFKHQGIPTYNIYNVPMFRNSTLTKFTKEFDIAPDIPLYSNYHGALYIYTQKKSTSPPNKYHELDYYRGSWPSSLPAYLIWYEPNQRNDIFYPDALEELAEFTPIYSSIDGNVFLITQKP